MNRAAHSPAKAGLLSSGTVASAGRRPRVGAGGYIPAEYCAGLAFFAVFLLELKSL